MERKDFFWAPAQCNPLDFKIDTSSPFECKNSLEQVDADICDFNNNFQIKFSFKAQTKDYAGLFGMRAGKKIIMFAVRDAGPGFHFGAHIDAGSGVLTTNSFGQKTFKIEQINTNQDYMVEMTYDKNSKELLIKLNNKEYY